MNSNSPVFIVSSPRSGSTLFRLILNAHSKIGIPPPGFMFPMIYPFLHTYGDLDKQANLDLLIGDVLEFQQNKPWPFSVAGDDIKAAMKEPGFVGVYRAIKEIWCERYDKERWGSKTPRNIHWIGEILSCFPDAQFIHICRDGRDVAVDLMENLNWPKNVYHAALLWQESMRAIRTHRSKLAGNQLLEVKYEDLVTSPEKTVRQVCTFIGEEFEPSMLEYYMADETTKWANSDHCHRNVRNPVNDQFIGIHKRLLTLSDQELLAGLIGPELGELGYRVDVEPRQAAAVELKMFNEDARANELGSISFKIRHWEKRRKRLEDGIWSAQGQSRAFG